MGHIDIQYLLMWGAVMALVFLAARTGMLINSFFIHRAHRKALAELRRRTLEHIGEQNAADPVTIRVKI